VLANDKDFEGDALHISAINGQAIAVGGTVVLGDGSSVTLNANQTLTFNPNSAFQSLNGGEQGHEIFTYTVTDSQGASSAPTSVDVTVNGAWETPTFFADAELDASARKAAPHEHDMINGGGIPADHFGIVRADDAGIELALKVHHRSDGVQPPYLTSDDYADGVLHFTVDDGQAVAGGSPKAEWSFDYSIATGLNGETTGLSDFHFKLLVDVDKSSGTDFHVFELGAGGVGSANTHWTDTSAPAQLLSQIGDDAGVPNKVTQNSENYGFGFIRNFIDNDPGTPGIQTYNFGPGEFDIILQAFDNSNTLIAQNHIQVDVVL